MLNAGISSLLRPIEIGYLPVAHQTYPSNECGSGVNLCQIQMGITEAKEKDRVYFETSYHIWGEEDGWIYVNLWNSISHMNHMICDPY